MICACVHACILNVDAISAVCLQSFNLCGWLCVWSACTYMQASMFFYASEDCDIFLLSLLSCPCYLHVCCLCPKVLPHMCRGRWCHNSGPFFPTGAFCRTKLPTQSLTLFWIPTGAGLVWCGGLLLLPWTVSSAIPGRPQQPRTDLQVGNYNYIHRSITCFQLPANSLARRHLWLHT